MGVLILGWYINYSAQAGRIDGKPRYQTSAKGVWPSYVGPHSLIVPQYWAASTQKQTQALENIIRATESASEGIGHTQTHQKDHVQWALNIRMEQELGVRIC